MTYLIPSRNECSLYLIVMRLFWPNRVSGSVLRSFSSKPTVAPLSPAASAALLSIKQSLASPGKPTQLTKKQRNSMQGNITRFFRKGNKPEFWSSKFNSNQRLFEPTDTFEAVITSSKNNVWIAVLNKGRMHRTVFQSHAGNVGISKSKQRDPETAYRIGENIARKLKRLGVSCVDVRFRRLMRVDQVLNAFQAHNLRVTRLTHQPRLPFGYQHRPRNRRRV